MQTNETVEQLTLFGQDLWCGKTCPELSPAQTARTSGRSSKKPSELRTADYLFLDLRPGGGNLLGPCWEKNSPLLGAFWTLNTGASPKDAVESSLSQILQAEVPRRYYLSKTACLGILRRAEERGKELPAQLKAALEVQAGVGGGDISSTLGVNCETSTGRNGVTTPTAFSANQRDEVRDLHDVAGALGAQPGMKQQTFIAQDCLTPWDVQSRRIMEDSGTWPALYGGEGGGHGYVKTDRPDCLTPWDTQQERIFTPEGKAPTLAGADGGGGRNPAGLLFAAGVVTKGNGDCFISLEKHTALSQGGGQAGQGYPCVMTAGFCAGAGPSAGTIGYQEERAPTLKASASGNMMPSILCLNDH